MKYRLSMDLGVGSVVAAILPLDENNRVTDMLDVGADIFKVSEGAEERRLARHQRKNNYRTKKRLSLLSEELAEAGLWSFDEDIQAELIPHSPYRIRAVGVNGKLENVMELGRAILHMAKHRGASFVEIQELELELEKEAQEDKENDNKKNKKLSEYAKLWKYLDESGAQTVGEYFYMRLNRRYKKNEPSHKTNNIKDKNRRYVRQRTITQGGKPKVDYAIPRYLVKEEFNLLWDTQLKYYKQLKDKKLKKKINDILFYEHDHRPYATGNCIFIEEEKRLTKAHPLSEKRRIYEAVNNIRIRENTKQTRLEKWQRDLIINELLFKGEKAGKRAIRKVLQLDKNCEIILSDIIQPYLYSTQEYKSIDFLNNLDEGKLAEIVEFMADPRKEDDNNYLYNDEALIEILKNKFNTEDEKLISQLIAMLPKGRGSLGQTATQKILDLLKQDVISIREATDKLAEKDPGFISEEERARAIQGKYNKLPYYGEILRTDTQPIADWQKQINKSLNPDERDYGKIANPGVHRMLNQLRKVVNDIIRIYGKPYDIHIELAREVGMSSKKKRQYENQRDENKRKNDKAVEYLKKNKIRVTGKNILKWRLANQQGWKDVFSKTLDSIHRRFEGFEIEHLIPRSVGGPDGKVNRVLIKRSDNLSKGNMYPYEYLQSKYGEQMYQILAFVRKSNLSDGKKWRFESDAREKFESGDDSDSLTRYLNDTRYFSKLAARYLKAIVDYKPGYENNTRVLTINGGHTAKLRGIWNLDGIEYELMGLEKAVPKYLPSEPYYLNKDTGEVLYQKELDVDGNWEKCDTVRNKDWQKKPRYDHRHHIVDAITVGMVSRADMQKINWHDKRGYELPFKQLPVPLSNGKSCDKKEQLEVFRNKVKAALKDVKIYHKPDHSKKGRLHKETGRYALMTNPDNPDKTITRYNRAVSKILKSKANLKNLLIDTKNVKPQWDKTIAEDAQEMIKLKAAIESHFDQAEKQLKDENSQLIKEGKKEKRITEPMILNRAFNIVRQFGEYGSDTYPVYDNSESLIYIPKHAVAYEKGANHRIDFYQDGKGKVGWECISMFDANDKEFIPEWKQKKHKPIWSLHKGDMIELDTPEEWKKYTSGDRCFAVVDACHGKLGTSFHSDARDTTGKNGSHSKRDSMIRRLGFYTEHNARKIELTPFGKIKRKHKKLWNGKKKTTKQVK